jgi:signal transduction histidine kinase
MTKKIPTWCFAFFMFCSTCLFGQNDEAKWTSSVLQIMQTGGFDATAMPEVRNLFEVIFSKSEEYRKQGEFDKAMEFDFFALQLAENLDSAEFLSRAYNNIAISYYRIKVYEKAEKFFLTAEAIRSVTGDSLRLADTYYNLGMLNDDLGHFDKAKNYYSKALHLFSAKNIIDGMADVYNGLAGHYYMIGKIDSVQYYANKALEMFTLLGRSDAVAFMHINIASLENMQGLHLNALSNITKGIEFAKQTNNINQLRQGYKNLSETYSYLGDFENAYKNHLVYEQYKDSVFNNEKALIIEELQTKYETDKALKELNEKKAEVLQMEVDIQKSKNDRNIVILALIIIIMFALFLWHRSRANKRTSAILNQKNKELNELNATKDMFFSIISHDLKSPVSSVARLVSGLEKSIDLLDKPQLKSYLSELAGTTNNLNEFLKKLLHWALSQKGGLKPVFANYKMCDILNEVVLSEKAQAELKNSTIRLDCNSQIEIYADRSMIETVVRNFLSNAVKFAHPQTEILIMAFQENGNIKVSIKNSGDGISEENAKKLFKIDGHASMNTAHPSRGTGLGLILCAEFVRLHNGDVFLEDGSPQNTCFSFTIPTKL